MAPKTQEELNDLVYTTLTGLAEKANLSEKAMSELTEREQAKVMVGAVADAIKLLRPKVVAHGKLLSSHNADIAARQHEIKENEKGLKDMDEAGQSIDAMEEAEEHFRLQRGDRLKLLVDGEGLNPLVLDEDRLRKFTEWEDSPRVVTTDMYTPKRPFIADTLRELFGDDTATTSWSIDQVDEALTRLISRQLQQVTIEQDLQSEHDVVQGLTKDKQDLHIKLTSTEFERNSATEELRKTNDSLSELRTHLQQRKTLYDDLEIEKIALMGEKQARLAAEEELKNVRNSMSQDQQTHKAVAEQLKRMEEDETQRLADLAEARTIANQVGEELENKTLELDDAKEKAVQMVEQSLGHEIRDLKKQVSTFRAEAFSQKNNLKQSGTTWAELLLNVLLHQLSGDQHTVITERAFAQLSQVCDLAVESQTDLNVRYDFMHDAKFAPGGYTAMSSAKLDMNQAALCMALGGILVPQQIQQLDHQSSELHKVNTIDHSIVLMYCALIKHITLDLGWIERAICHSLLASLALHYPLKDRGKWEHIVSDIVCTEDASTDALTLVSIAKLILTVDKTHELLNRIGLSEPLGFTSISSVPEALQALTLSRQQNDCVFFTDGGLSLCLVTHKGDEVTFVDPGNGKWECAGGVVRVEAVDDQCARVRAYWGGEHDCFVFTPRDKSLITKYMDVHHGRKLFELEKATTYAYIQAELDSMMA